MAAGVTCVVPARLGSTRFFGKLLHPLLGKPLVVHTLERAAGAGCFARVVCLTDSPEIAAAVRAHGFDSVPSGEAANGTERIARRLDALEGNLFVNLQGDEPAFPEEGLRTLRAALLREPDLVHLLVHEDAPAPDEVENPHRVKAVVDADGFVAAFVRTPPRGGAPAGAAYRLQSGAYGYSRAYLERYAALPASAEETALSHEMLRAPGLAPMRAHPAPAGVSVDVPADLAPALAALLALNDPASIEPQPRLQGTAP